MTYNGATGSAVTFVATGIGACALAEHLRLGGSPRPTDKAGAVSKKSWQYTIYKRMGEVGCTPLHAEDIIAVLETCPRSSHTYIPSQSRYTLAGTALRTHKTQAGWMKEAWPLRVKDWCSVDSVAQSWRKRREEGQIRSLLLCWRRPPELPRSLVGYWCSFTHYLAGNRRSEWQKVIHWALCMHLI
jgi:hypothetical protein